MRQDLLIHIQTLYDDIGMKQAQADLKGVQVATDQTTAALSRSEISYLSAAKAAQEGAITDTILARAKQELAIITAQQTAGLITEAEAQQLLLALRQSTLAALTQHMSAGTAEINMLSALTLSSRELAAAQAQVAAGTEVATAAMTKQAATAQTTAASQWRLTAPERLYMPGSLGLFRLHGPMLGIAGLTMLVAGLKGAMEAAEKEEKALVSLSATLRNITPYYEQATQAAHNFTLKLAYQSMFTHKELLDGFQRLVALGVPLSQVYDMLTTATDLATARNIGLDNAVEALGRAYAGQTMRLSRLGIVMWDATGRVKSFEQVQKELNEQFGGTAAAQMDSNIGRMQQYKVAMDEARQTLGRYIEDIKGLFALGAVRTIAPLTQGIEDDLVSARGHLALLKKALDEALKAPEQPVRTAGGVIKFDTEGARIYQESLREQIATQEEYIAQLEKETKYQESVYAGEVSLARVRDQAAAQLAEIDRILEETSRTKLLPSSEKAINELLSQRADLSREIIDIDRKIEEAEKGKGQKSRQEIAQTFQDYKDLIDLYNSLLEQTSKAGDYTAWKQYKESAGEAIDSVIKDMQELLKTQEAGGGMDLYVRNLLQQIVEARQKIREATFYEPRIELLGARINYAQAIGDTKLLTFTRQELLKVYDQEIHDLTEIISSGHATIDTWKQLNEVATKQAEIVADIRSDMLAISQFKFQQAEFGFKYGTTGTEGYLAAIDQRIADIRSEQQKLNQDSQEYMELQNEINSLLMTRKETADSIAEAEEKYQIALAEYTAKTTGNQKELLAFYQQYRADQEALLDTLISGTEQWWAQKQKILGIDEKILSLTNSIAQAEERAAEISYHRTAASNAMEYYQGKNLGRWESAKRDYLKALEEEENYLKTLLAQTPKGTQEQWSILSKINDLDYERLRIIEKQFETEKGITNELKMQSGLFNLPEFVRFGLPMLLASNLGGTGGGRGGGAPSIQQNNTVNIYGGYQMTAQEMASKISKEIQKFSQMAGNSIWYGVR